MVWLSGPARLATSDAEHAAGTDLSVEQEELEFHCVPQVGNGGIGPVEWADEHSSTPAGGALVHVPRVATRIRLRWRERRTIGKTDYVSRHECWGGCIIEQLLIDRSPPFGQVVFVDVAFDIALRNN